MQRERFYFTSPKPQNIEQVRCFEDQIRARKAGFAPRSERNTQFLFKPQNIEQVRCFEGQIRARKAGFAPRSARNTQFLFTEIA